MSNRFMAMPGYRTRILGLQCYKENVAGFLQWALNFYNSRYSMRHLNPFYETDGDGAFPSGDAFMIYPAPTACHWSRSDLLFSMKRFKTWLRCSC